MVKQLKHTSIPLNQIQITDSYWSKYFDLVRTTIIPYQWEALNDRIEGAEPSYAVQNFRIAAGVQDGEFGGMVFQDSDLAKWLESVGYLLSSHQDAELERIADELIDLIVAAQRKDGYLNTYFLVKEPGKEWTNVTDCHELYCAGHMIEAAIAYYQGTGKRKLLDAMCHFADYIAQVFGDEPGKIRGYDGHQEIELALVKLYEVTHVDTYLKLSQYFIQERGQTPSFFVKEWEQRGKTSHWVQGKSPSPTLSYHQAHLTVKEQHVAIGHSVRATYMYTAMADLAIHTADQSLRDACQRLWNNMVHKQMYVTGSIGSTFHGEAFTFDYDLPNDTNYSETCASIGLIFFAKRMLQLHLHSEYADVMERALYNTVTAGIAMDGKHYFYVNPMEVWPEASVKNPGRHHQKATRQKWYGCSCCPPNAARLIASMGDYIYSLHEDTLFVHLYIGNKTQFTINNQLISLELTSELPSSGHVNVNLAVDQPVAFRLALRLPGWSPHTRLYVNGTEITSSNVDGYAYVERTWSSGDQIHLEMDMTPKRIYGHPKLRASAGKVALQRGPLIYCMEEVDNGDGLHNVILANHAPFTETILSNGYVALHADAWIEEDSSWHDNQLYRESAKTRKKKTICAVPYTFWGNRTPGEMMVWMREEQMRPHS